MLQISNWIIANLDERSGAGTTLPCMTPIILQEFLILLDNNSSQSFSWTGHGRDQLGTITEGMGLTATSHLSPSARLPDCPGKRLPLRRNTHVSIAFKSEAPIFNCSCQMQIKALPAYCIVLYSSIYIAPSTAVGQQRRFWFE